MTSKITSKNKTKTEKLNIFKTEVKKIRIWKDVMDKKWNNQIKKS